jgi:hypothetical protein
LSLAALQPGDENKVSLSPLTPGILYVVREKGEPAPGLRVVAAPHADQPIPTGALINVAAANGLDEYQLLATSREGIVALPTFLEPGRYDFFVTVKTDKLPVFKPLGALDLPLGHPEVIVYRPSK